MSRKKNFALKFMDVLLQPAKPKTVSQITDKCKMPQPFGYRIMQKFLKDGMAMLYEEKKPQKFFGPTPTCVVGAAILEYQLSKKSKDVMYDIGKLKYYREFRDIFEKWLKFPKFENVIISEFGLKRESKQVPLKDDVSYQTLLWQFERVLEANLMVQIAFDKTKNDIPQKFKNAIGAEMLKVTYPKYFEENQDIIEEILEFDRGI